MPSRRAAGVLKRPRDAERGRPDVVGECDGQPDERRSGARQRSVFQSEHLRPESKCRFSVAQSCKMFTMRIFGSRALRRYADQPGLHRARLGVAGVVMRLNVMFTFPERGGHIAADRCTTQSRRRSASAHDGSPRVTVKRLSILWVFTILASRGASYLISSSSSSSSSPSAHSVCSSLAFTIGKRARYWAAGERPAPLARSSELRLLYMRKQLEVHRIHRYLLSNMHGAMKGSCRRI